jgi:GNAT superfamily N-acetyltransferase
MPVDTTVERVERDRILDFRGRVLGGSATGSRAFSRDLATTTRHWAAIADGFIVGCVSVMQLRGYALRGMAVAVEHRRQGIGTRMLRAVCEEVDAPLWCNARIQAVPFYLHRGWVEVGPRFDLRDRGAHQRLAWTGTPPGRRVIP